MRGPKYRILRASEGKMEQSVMTAFPATLPEGQRLHGKPRLLLAENDSALWLLLSGLLQPEYEVEVVHDGEEAWAAAQLQIPALILTDLQMPFLDGIGLARRLRADARTATLPIVFLTGCTVKGTRLRCLEAGGNAFMVKPFHVSELLACPRDDPSPEQRVAVFAKKGREFWRARSGRQ